MITAKVEHVTPAMAERWLGSVEHDRVLNKNKGRRLAEVIAEGGWRLNGEAIKFNSSHMIDGQHRCLAVLLAETAIDTLVVRGIEDDARPTLDQGRKRSVGDVLTMEGESNGNRLAAMLNTLYRYLHDQEHTWQGGTGVTPPEALALLAGHPSIRASVKFGDEASKGTARAMPPGLAGGIHYIFAQISETEADIFFERLADGADLAAGSPILALRRVLLRIAQDPYRRGGARGDTSYIHAVTVKAWNALREGRLLTDSRGAPALRWRKTGSRVEPFPKPK